MPTIEEIQKQIEALGKDNVDTFGTKKEIRHLPEILQADEGIKALSSGMMKGNTWLIVCTNKRIIFLDKGMLYGLKQVETPLNKINSIEQKTGVIFGEIIIWDGASKMVIDNVLKWTVKPFVNALNEQIDNLRKGNQSSGGSGDIAEQIKKLAALKEQGILTAEEFDHQKKKLLGM